MAVETHTQVGTGKRLVREDGTNRPFGWLVTTSPTTPGSVIPPAIELVVVAGGAPDINTLGVGSLRNVFPDPLGFRAMTAPEQATADAAGLLEAQIVGKATVDSTYESVRSIRGLVVSSENELADARDARKASIDGAATPAAVQALLENLSIELNTDLVEPSLDSTYNAMFDGDSAFVAGPLTDNSGTYQTLTAVTIPSLSHGGDFEVVWSMSAAPGNSNRTIQVRLFDVTDAVNLSKEFRFEPKNNSEMVSVGAHRVVIVSATTAKDIEIQFRLANGSGNVEASDGLITLKRLTSVP